ncbi:MAG TPA: PIG-L family deacetylase [Verrucomicrobiae bacterium]|nr:PIG-L family deacetylase [Verrucomicrobiae bacterium]
MKAKAKTTKRSTQSSKKRSIQKRQRKWWPELPKRTWFVIGGSVLILGLAVATSALVTHVDANRYRPPRRIAYLQSMYNVADVLSQRPASTLVTNQSMLNVLHPTLGRQRRTFTLNTCPSATDAVIKQLQKHSIAVLLDIDNNPGPHQCTLAQIVQAYGRPNSSTTLTGSLTNPKEVLLFYDNGPELSGPLKPVSPPQAPATVVPTTLASLPPSTCGGKTFLSFVAHEDDDLLFMNPDHLHDLRNGGCLRTVYLTAGDAGLSSGYWLGREKGAEAAYDTMIGHGPSLWIERYVSVTSGEYIRMASPRGNPSVTLIFLHLPDGDVSGGGFPRTHYESLARLESGAISKIDSVDGQSSYTKSSLTNLLVSLMQYYHPDEIDTQTPLSENADHPDHSDHITTGQFTAAAFATYARSVPLVYYTGYPISLQPENVSGQDLADKSAVFYAYAAHDSLVCKNAANCMNGPYPEWLAREYTYTPGEPAPPDPSSTPAPTPTTPTPTTTTPTTTPPTTPDPTTTPPTTTPPATTTQSPSSG